MQGYAEFADAVKEVFTIATRIAAARGINGAATYEANSLVPNAESASALSNAESRRARAWESVLLLGAPETVEAGRAWWHEVWRFVWFAKGWLSDPDQWEVAQAESESARQRFYECARRDLGVRGAASAIGPLHPRWLQPQAAADRSPHHGWGRQPGEPAAAAPPGPMETP
jgi:hypothetical protein